MKYIVLAVVLLFAVAVNGVTDMIEYFLLDDFSTDRSTLDTEWEGFTDQVMGGVSEMSVVKASDDTGPYVRMRGRVSLDNNGGFIQIRLKLGRSGNFFDGEPYTGVRVEARGAGEGYYIFLRTADMVFPWKYYAAPIPVSEDWAVLDIPWSAFKPGDYGRSGKLRINKIKSLAVVAYGKEFEAEIDVCEVGLY